MTIKDKVIIVTGASHGIGRATAEALAKKGAKVVLAARSAAELEAFVKLHPNVFPVPTDMTKPAQVARLIDQSMKRHGRIDILINNAGVGMHCPIENVDIDEYKKMMELNVFAVLRAMQTVIPIMRAQGGGMILNVSSRVSKNYFPGLAAYASTKYALNCLSLTARAELAPDKIVVSVMHPKMTATDFSKNSMGKHPDYEEIRRSRPAMPEMQIDTPEQVAERIVELIGSEVAEAEM